MDSQTIHEREASLTSNAPATGTKVDSQELVFIDSRVPAIGLLMQSLRAQLPKAEIHHIDTGEDGVRKIASILSERTEITNIRIISHGRPGHLYLGTADLNGSTIDTRHAASFSVIKGALSENAEILIYGCRFAAGAYGEQTLQKIAGYTGADVAASTNFTGDVTRGGDWTLERSVGSISSSAIQADGWNHLLADFVAGTPTSVTVTGSSGAHTAATFFNYGTVGSQTVDLRAEVIVGGSVERFFIASGRAQWDDDDVKVIRFTLLAAGTSTPVVADNLPFYIGELDTNQAVGGAVNGLRLVQTQSGTRVTVVNNFAYSGTTYVRGTGTASASGPLDAIRFVWSNTSTFTLYSDLDVLPGHFELLQGTFTTPVNVYQRQAPVLTSPSSVTFTADGTPVVVNSSIGVSDADSTTLSSATIRLTGYAAGTESLAFTPNASTMGNITGSFNSSTGILTLTSAGSTATLAQFQAALRSITYFSSTNTTNRQVSFVVNDGVLNSEPLVSSLQYVSPRPPVVDLNSNPSSSSSSSNSSSDLIINGNFGVTAAAAPPAPWVEGSSAAAGSVSNDFFSSITRWSWTDNGGPGATLSQAVTVQPPSTSNSSTATSQTVHSTTDQLSSITFLLAWQDSTSDSASLQISYNGVVYGLFQTSAGPGSNAAGILGTLAYSNGATNASGTTAATTAASSASISSPTLATITINLPAGITTSGSLEFLYTESGSAAGDEIAIDNVALNNTMTTISTVTSVDGDYDWSANYLRGGSSVSITDTDNSIFDADSANIVSAVITLTNAQAGDLLAPLMTLPAGITASSYNPSNGQLTLSGSATKANYATAIRSIGFSTTSASTVARTVTTTVNDGGLNSNTAITTITISADSEGDGLADEIDLDDDNDGIPDTVENATAINGGDTDGDGVPDIFDLDSDNDGILDFVEARNLTPAQVDALDANNDGRLDGAVGSDGIPDVVQTSPNAGTVTYTPLDTDGDSHPDFQDLDADNDGINDVREANGTDVNNNGIVDGTVGSSGIPASVPAGGLVPPDTDSDGKPDFRDLDADNDGINDVTEAGLSDPDNNGISGSGQVPADTDGDGIADTADGASSVFGDATDPALPNSDNDNVPDFRDLDSDNDTVSDVIEGGNGPADTNGDGTISITESPDGDGDGIPNNVDNNPVTYGDAGNTPVPNTDGDSLPNYRDPDSDGDGLTDLVEAGKTPSVLDPDGDGMVDSPSDPDGDGIPNNNGNDTIPGGFGGTSAPSTPVDSDGDGIPDVVDLDDDNDGIPDTVENATAINGGDTDGDGVPDIFDLDSDNDGILDFVEARNLTPAQVDELDANNDGRLDGAVGSDGIPDVVQTSPNAGTVTYTPLDTDGDSHPDFQDLDADNDGINDVREANGTDVNNNGIADGTVGSSGIPASVPAGGLVPPDTDSDGKPDFRDLDADNDGINDVTEAGLSDPDNNGISGSGQVPADTDGDGIADTADGASSVFGDATDPALPNSDNDSVPDYRDLDSDNDTISDVIEGGNGPADTNGDGTISITESPDGDGDGIPNNVDNTPGTYGDAGNTPVPNTDGDGLPDYRDPDSDGDGITDLIESGKNPSVLDPNGDGMVDNPTDPDGDGIPNNNGNDSVPGGFGGATPPSSPTDSDNDGIPDIIDLDDDNDGIPDTVENATAINSGDTDGDGVPDILDLDSDNDGILDFVEARNLTPAQVDALDANNDGRLDGAVGSDGIPDVVQASPNAGAANYTPLDTDGDSRPDFQDLDADNDGINDVREANGTDTDGNGLVDGIAGANGIPASVPAGGLVPPDTDSDGKPDFRDLDADNDGINDVTEAGLSDPDNNGIVGSGQVPTDTDNDGIVNVTDGTPASFGDATDPAPLNSDNDSVPDYRDLDSDNDTVSDVIEGGNGPADTNGDGTISTSESPDGDGDGIPNNVDNNPATYGDAGNTPVPSSDGDGSPNYRDPDSDGDGITDLVEAGKDPTTLDPNGDGMIDSPTDPDGDGIPNNNGNDTIPGGFGGTSAPSTPADADSDGIPDVIDLDDDNDGIPDTVENATAINSGDTDGDGVPDILDLDSDNDGILDFVEARNLTPAQVDALDANNDGRLDGPVGTDGIPDVVQASANTGTANYTPLDTDGDSRPDFQDLDTDNDGINDVREANGTDANNNGIADGAVGSSGIPASVPAGGLVPPDTDSDGKPDFRDLDTDNDGINDVTEAGLSDPDNNGIAGTGQVPADTDGDGIANVVDGTPSVFGDATDPTLPNSDNDNVPDFRDLDSDNDTVSDVIEGGNGPADTNGDGTISISESPDGDGDGIPNNVDNTPATYGDAGNTPVPNTDGDGLPNYRDPDSDGDGVADLVEAGKNPSVLDPDGDGMVDNPTDPDGDGIPNNNGNDTIPGGFGGVSQPTTPTDNDSDGVPDIVDLDDDNDGIPDTVENANAINGGDTDGDTVPDLFDLDSDGDGILDVIEAGHAGLDANHDGRVDTPVGANGLANVVETTADSGVINYVPLDTDIDGRPDYVDLDSDNDSISDVLESGNTLVSDDDNDGLADGVPNSRGIVAGATAGNPVDSDADSLPDYRDVDSNNDGLTDIADNGYSSLDANADGRMDSIVDIDADGIADIYDLIDEEYGWFPAMGCANWNLNNVADTDGDVFPESQEYAFGGSPIKGDHLVTGTTRRQGLALVKNGTGGLTASMVRPQGRYDVTFTLVVSTDLIGWTELSEAIPAVTSNGDGTDTLTWSNVQNLAPVSASRGFIRMKVETPCDPAGSYTLVQGWCLETASGSRQTHGLNFTSLPVYTGVVTSASGATLVLTASANGTDLSAFVPASGSYYVEFTDGGAEGHRFDVASGSVAGLTLNLSSKNNTAAALPSGTAGSHFVIRKHFTLGESYPASLYRRSSSAGSADQIQFYNGNGFDTYFAFPTNRWVKQGAGTSSQDNLVIPPGEAAYVIHSNSADSHMLLQTGDVRYNDFIRPVKLGTTGINFIALGFPFNASPSSLNMNVANGFVASSTVGGATLIQNWNGDATVNAVGYTTNFQLSSGNWRTQGQITNVTTNAPLFMHCSGTFLNVKADKLDWKHLQPWQPLPWVQP